MKNQGFPSWEINREVRRRYGEPEINYLEDQRGRDPYLTFVEAPQRPSPRDLQRFARQGFATLMIASGSTPLARTARRIGETFFQIVSLKHFVITEDVQPLLSRWATQHPRLCLPPSHVFREHLRQHLVHLRECYLEPPLVLEYHSLRRSINRLARSHARGTTTVSLDRLYFPSADFTIDVTRVRHFRTKKPLATVARPGALPFRQQIDRFRKTHRPNRPVTLIVDGCWSGTEITQVFAELKKRGYVVSVIIAGILRPASYQELRNTGADIYGAHFLHPDPWHCERDHTPGVPRGGYNAGWIERGRVICDPADTGFPYLYPFCDDNQIFDGVSETRALDYSYARLSATISLFREIERLSQRLVYTRHLARLPYGLPTGRIPFIHLLEQIQRTRF